jgi:hypothetical protein
MFVREDRRAEEVAVAVYRVDAVEQRDLQPRVERGALEAVDHVGPRLRRVLRRRRAAAREDRSELPGRDRGLVVEDLVALGLRHLPDLLLERHARQEVGDALVHGLTRILIGGGRGRGCRREREQGCRQQQDPRIPRHVSPPQR